MNTSCTEDSLEEDTPLPLTDNQIQPYFDRFEVEATLRGRTVDLHSSGIYGVFEKMDSGVLGNCSYRPSDAQRKIRIDPDQWNKAHDLMREWIVFHELGHCYLERGHDDSKNGNICKSIMNSGGDSGCRLTYNSNTRSRYLDELFTNY